MNKRASTTVEVGPDECSYFDVLILLAPVTFQVDKSCIWNYYDKSEGLDLILAVL